MCARGLISAKSPGTSTETAENMKPLKNIKKGIFQPTSKLLT